MNTHKFNPGDVVRHKELRDSIVEIIEIRDIMVAHHKFAPVYKFKLQNGPYATMFINDFDDTFELCTDAERLFYKI